MSHCFGQNLKTIRLEKRLSQAELGSQLNKGQKTIGNWETGYSEPCIEDLVRISQLFAISLDQLLKEEIKRDNLKTKAGRNRHKDNEFYPDKSPLAISEIKHVLPETIATETIAHDGEIAWRNQYIAVLENRLFETMKQPVSGETIHDLMTRILSLQKMVAKLAGSAVAVVGEE